MFKSVTLSPRLSEKTYAQSEKRIYAFNIPVGVNKHTVAQAVAAQFEVVVTSVRITNIPGKAKRSMTKRRQYRGRDTATRKAYVTLAEGNSLPFFAAGEEAEAKQEAVQEKVDKAIAKQTAKDAKKTAKETK